MVDKNWGKRVIIICFFVLSALLIIVLVTQGIKIYKSSTEFVDIGTKPSIDCTSIWYTVNKIVYEDSDLAFDVLYQSSSDPENISLFTVISEDSRSVDSLFLKGIKKRLTFENMVVKDGNFTLYPENCFDYAVACNIEDQLCR